MERPRNHVLESESRREFESLVPDNWVLRKEDPDYGLDLGVEVFDRDRHSTGMRFHVQVRSTDASPDESRLSIEREHLEYWMSHEQPTLLVFYHADARTFVWNWEHCLDWRLKRGAKSVDVISHLRPWTDDTPDEIVSFLERRRCFWRFGLQSPCQIVVRDDDGDLSRATQLGRALRSNLETDMFDIVSGVQTEGDLTVTYDGSRVAFTLLGAPGVVFHIDDEIRPQEVTGLILLGLFVTGAMFDQEQICREILKENREPLAKLVGGKAGVIFVGSLVRTVGVKEAVSIVLSHDHPEERRRRYDEMVLFATVTANMPEYETEWTSQLVEWADSPPFEEVAGKAAYNAASALARTGEYDDAIKYFETAIEREPNYKDRAYIFEELAAAKFEAGLYAEAIEDYRTAGDLEPDLNVAFRIADALFHLGRFADALKIFREADIPADGSYFRLRSFQCVELVEEMGFRNQTPEEVPDDVHESVQRDPITDKSQLKDFVQEILAHAPTDPILNYNAGHLARISGDSTLAFYRFLTSAMQDPGDADAWAQTVGAGLNAVISAPLGSRASAPLIALSDVVEAASFFIGREQLAEELIRIIPGDELTPDARNSFHKMLMQLARSVPDESPKDMLLRVFDDEEQQVDEWTFDP